MDEGGFVSALSFLVSRAKGHTRDINFGFMDFLELHKKFMCVYFFFSWSRKIFISTSQMNRCFKEESVTESEFIFRNPSAATLTEHVLQN